MHKNDLCVPQSAVLLDTGAEGGLPSQQQWIINHMIAGSISSKRDYDRVSYLDRTVLLVVNPNAARKAGSAVRKEIDDHHLIRISERELLKPYHCLPQSLRQTRMPKNFIKSLASPSKYPFIVIPALSPSISSRKSNVSVAPINRARPTVPHQLP